MGPNEKLVLNFNFGFLFSRKNCRDWISHLNFGGARLRSVMPPNTEGSGPYSSGTKVLLDEGPDLRQRINIPVSDKNMKSNYASISKGQGERGLSFHIKKLAWTLFTIPICRAIVFVVFAIVSSAHKIILKN